MPNAELLDRFNRPRQPLGSLRRTLRCALGDLLLEGLDDAAATALERRWGSFLSPEEGSAPAVVLRVTEGSGWLPAAAPGDVYRMERVECGGQALVVSYHFAVGSLETMESARPIVELAVERTHQEPIDRILDNATRLVVARLAMGRGGFAMHGAGIFHEQRAYIYAGPSRAGKSTAVGLSHPARSLGDDFAIAMPGTSDDDWVTCALPFDNHPVEAPPAVGGFVPLQGIWRLFQASPEEEVRVETPPRLAATTSLMTCAAFPDAISDCSDRLLNAVSAVVATGRFGHLHFARNSEFWTLIAR